MKTTSGTILKMKPVSALDWYDDEQETLDKIPSLRRGTLFARHQLDAGRDNLNDMDFSLLFEPASASATAFTLNPHDEVTPPPSPSPIKLTREALRELFLDARIGRQGRPALPSPDESHNVPPSESSGSFDTRYSASSTSSFSALARTCDSIACASCPRKDLRLFWNAPGPSDTGSTSDEDSCKSSKVSLVASKFETHLVDSIEYVKVQTPPQDPQHEPILGMRITPIEGQKEGRATLSFSHSSNALRT